MKRIISLVCVIVLILSFNVCAFASSGESAVEKTSSDFPINITNISSYVDKYGRTHYCYWDTDENKIYNFEIYNGHVNTYTETNLKGENWCLHLPLMNVKTGKFVVDGLDKRCPYLDTLKKYFSTANTLTASAGSTSQVTQNKSSDIEVINNNKSSNNNTACWVEIEKGINMLLSPAWLENETDEFDAKFTHSSNNKYTAIVLSDLEEYKASKSIDDIFNTYVKAGYQESLVKMNINGISAIGVVQEDTYVVVLPKDTDSFFQIRFLNFDKNDSLYLNYIGQMVRSISASN